MDLRELMVLLVAARYRKGFSQRDIATRMNTSQGRVNDIENLRYIPRLATLERYAAIVDMQLMITVAPVPVELPLSVTGR